MKSYLRSHYQCIMECNSSALRAIPPDVKEEMDAWQMNLASFKKLKILVPQTPIDLDWTRDTSSGYGIGVVIGASWGRFQLSDDWKTSDKLNGTRDIAWAKTAAIQIGLLMLHKIQDTEGKVFVVQSDNSVTEASICNRKSRSAQVNREWQKIQLLLTNMGCDIQERRVASADNTADRLSQGDTQGRLWSDEVIIITLPPDLAAVLTQT